MVEGKKKFLSRPVIFAALLVALVPIRPLPGDPPRISRSVFEEEFLKIDQALRYPFLEGYSHEEVAHVYAFTTRGIRGMSLIGATVFFGGSSVHAFGIAPKVMLEDLDLQEVDGRFFATRSDVERLREMWTLAEWNHSAPVSP